MLLCNSDNHLEWTPVEWDPVVGKWVPTGKTLYETLFGGLPNTPEDASSKPKQTKPNKMSDLTPIEPLEFDEAMDDVDTSYPVLKPCIMDLEIQGPIQKAENKKQDGYNAVIKYKTVDEGTSIHDKPVNAGLGLTEWYPLQSFDKETGDKTSKWKENFARLFDAALETSKENRPKLAEGLALLPKRLVRVRITVENDDNGVPRNRIAGFVKREGSNAPTEHDDNIPF
jgi:hypothetical protein